MKQALLRALRKLRNFFPSLVPSGAAEWNSFTASIIDTYQLPNNDSFRWIVAKYLMHFDRDRDPVLLRLLFGNGYVAKRRIYLYIRGAEGTQTAMHFFEEIKKAQQAAVVAKQLESDVKGPVAVTSAPLSVVPNEPPQNSA